MRMSCISDGWARDRLTGPPGSMEIRSRRRTRLGGIQSKVRSTRQPEGAPGSARNRIVMPPAWTLDAEEMLDRRPCEFVRDGPYPRPETVAPCTGVHGAGLERVRRRRTRSPVLAGSTVEPDRP